MEKHVAQVQNQIKWKGSSNWKMCSGKIISVFYLDTNITIAAFVKHFSKNTNIKGIRRFNVFSNIIIKKVSVYCESSKSVISLTESEFHQKMIKRPICQPN